MKDYFASAAAYYAKYRPFYPPGIIDDVVSFFKLTPDSRIIDIGSGTGQLAIQMAEHVKEVVAIEPDSDMIAEGKKLARTKNVNNIRWIQTIDTEIGGIPNLGTFRLATFGASFHWMNHDDLLSFLDSIIERDGGIAIAGSQSIWLPTEPWEEVEKQVVQKYLGEERRAGTGKFKEAAIGGGKFDDILRRSPFSAFEERQHSVPRRQTLDEVIGRLYSTSFANPAVLGDAREAFEHDLREALLGVNPNGIFEKTDNYYLFLARRP